MSRLSDPENPHPFPTPALRRAPTKILRNRKKNPLHPDEIARLIYERSKEGPRFTTPHKGWLLIYWDYEGQKRFTHVAFVKDPDGTRRPATYNDVVKIRDLEMDLYDYEKCWLIMKTAEDIRR